MTDEILDQAADALLRDLILLGHGERAEVVRSLRAELAAVTAQRDHLRTLGQGQRVIEMIEQHEALKAEHGDCLTVVHQQETELERAEEALAVITAERDAAYAVIRTVDLVWFLMEVPWEPKELAAIKAAKAATSDG